VAQATIINKFGSILGWNSITVNVLNRDLEGITDISYDDEQKMENEYGAGKYPIGQSEGNYEPKASMSLYSEELNALQSSLPAGKRIQDIPPFPIVVQYERNGVIIKDVLQNCRFKNNGREVKQADGKIVTKIDLLLSHIDWNSI
jgi:hypothetical protein